MIVLVALLCVALSIKLVLLLAFLLNFKKEVLITKDQDLPVVSILVAARNEESVLKNCIESLLKLDYPMDRIEILLGNDNSTDNTGVICAHYEAQYSFIRTVEISEDYQGLIAKANVIAQLAAQSTSEVLAIIDADMEVTAQWLRAMVSPTRQGFDLVSGFSVVKDYGLLSAIQRTDWMNGIFVLKALSDMKQPVTVLGNNMLITRKAYQTIGGFEAIGPTATEDNDITLAVVRAGFQVYQHVNDMGATTEPMSKAADLFAQRRRWVLGGLRHALPKVLAMFISRSCLLWALILAIFQPLWGGILLSSYLIMELMQLLLIYNKSGYLFSLPASFVTPFFNSVFDTFALFKIFFSRKIMWKERKM